jgi:membrane associated rhomboid family serine protease
MQLQVRAVSESLPQRLDRLIARAGFNLLLPPLILLIPWLQELVDQLVFGGNWNLPMTPGGSFLGVLTAPFSHSGFGHLLANSLTFLPLSLLLSLLALVTYAGVLPSLLPIFSPPGVSWIGHLSGFGGGLLAALAVARESPR